MIYSIIIFFIITTGLGISLVKLLNLNFNRPLEKFLMSIGLGLGVFPILSIILNLVHIPLNWITFLIISLIVPLFYLYKNKGYKFEFSFTKSDIYIVISVIFAAILFFVFLKGAFGYPYFEDDDPWGHSIGSSYVAEHNSYSRYTDVKLTDANFFRTYMEPYPPSYDVLMGVLHQTNDSIMWTLKFFNVLLVSLTIIFFYFFSEQFSQNKKKAIIATFIITILPCFMSHFIWAQTLGLLLVFPAFYCFERIKENWKWGIVGAIMTGSVLLSQPSTAVFFLIMAGIYWIAKIVVSYFSKEKLFNKNNNLILGSLIFGIVLSMIYWIPTLIKYGLMLTLEGVGIVTGLFGAANVDTSGGVVYSLMDYLVAPLASKMDQPTGIGVFAFLILIISIILLAVNYKKMKSNPYILTIFIWFIFTFIGTEGNALPFKLFPHRFWAFLAIPVALLIAEGMYLFFISAKSNFFKYSVLFVVFIGLIWTSAYPKYYVETSQWPPGATWSSGEELQGYMSLPTNLPKNTKIFNICSHEGKLLAFDMYTPPYDVDLFWFKLQMANNTLEDVYDVAKQRNFEYLVLDGYCVKRMSINQTNELLQQMANSTKFKLAGSNNAFWLFEVI